MGLIQREEIAPLRDSSQLGGDAACGVARSYGEQSVAGDSLVTSLLLPMIVCLIAAPLVRNEVRKSRLPAANWRRPRSGRAAHLLGNLFLHAVILGVLSALVMSPVTICTLDTLGVDEVGFWALVAFKASFADSRR